MDHRRVEYEAERFRLITKRYGDAQRELQQREQLLRAREGEVVGDRMADGAVADGAEP